MLLNRVYQTKFIKDVEMAKKRGLDIQKLRIVIDLLLAKKVLPARYKNHKLLGHYKGYLECHVEPDWLLIYMKTNTEIIFARTGTHSDLF